MNKKVKYIFFIIGIMMIIIGFPYLLGYTTNHSNKYFLYLGTILAIFFVPIPKKRNE